MNSDIRTEIRKWIIVVVILVLGYQLLGDVLTAIQSTTWPKTKGHVTESIQRGKSALMSTASISYEYAVNGMKYTGIRPLQGTPSRPAFEIAAYYRNHPFIEVSYNPRKPSRSYIEPGLSWREHGISIVVYVGFVGGFIWWWSWRSKKSAPGMTASPAHRQPAESYQNIEKR